jgi:hypothetical protein
MATTASPAHTSRATPTASADRLVSPSRYRWMNELPTMNVINWKKNNIPTTTAILLFDIAGTSILGWARLCWRSLADRGSSRDPLGSGIRNTYPPSGQSYGISRDEANLRSRLSFDKGCSLGFARNPASTRPSGGAEENSALLGQVAECPLTE